MCARARQDTDPCVRVNTEGRYSLRASARCGGSREGEREMHLVRSSVTPRNPRWACESLVGKRLLVRTQLLASRCVGERVRRRASARARALGEST
mmetsp:Transcript_15747/g.33655  ORF Transcript_15747/g.33655 Transcript_15747/m.33655 type:complete len:95 (+) Transcript_15747:350-634(+)